MQNLYGPNNPKPASLNSVIVVGATPLQPPASNPAGEPVWTAMKKVASGRTWTYEFIVAYSQLAQNDKANNNLPLNQVRLRVFADPWPRRMNNPERCTLDINLIRSTATTTATQPTTVVTTVTTTVTSTQQQATTTTTTMTTTTTNNAQQTISGGTNNQNNNSNLPNTGIESIPLIAVIGFILIATGVWVRRKYFSFESRVLKD